jgi:hypothetical protein
VLPFLPWLLLAACALLHRFMHGGHGRHRHDGGQVDRRGPDGEARSPRRTTPDDSGSDGGARREPKHHGRDEP